jgi:hypothetical protein
MRNEDHFGYILRRVRSYIRITWAYRQKHSEFRTLAQLGGGALKAETTSSFQVGC